MSGTTTPKRGKRLFTGLAIAIYLYLFAPIVWIVLFSFNKPQGKYNLQWQNFSFDAWANPFRDAELTQALERSLVVALVSVAIATLCGAAMALALSKYRFRGASAVDLFLVIPLTAPE
ncbi:MAG: ABC transporter permease, partial [Actinobacteria bacterium]|nr:ABC transporter permease [Actinomycetota bacterium]